MEKEFIVSYFFKLGRRLLTQRRRQDLPVLGKRPLDRMELQSLGPFPFTKFFSISSSSAVHGPFLVASSDLLRRLSISSSKFYSESEFTSVFLFLIKTVMWSEQHSTVCPDFKNGGRLKHEAISSMHILISPLFSPTNSKPGLNSL